MAVAAGTLEIQLLADVARLQKDMNAAQRSIGNMTKSAEAGATRMSNSFKSVGKATEQYAADVARLKGQLDPAWKSQQQYNRQVELGMRAFKAGAIDRQQFITHMRQINAELKNVRQPLQQVTKSSGAMRSGMQQLSFQLGDISQGFALGVKPMTIFAQQGGQVIQAVQLMTASSKGFLGFLAGPWGVALTSAVVVLGTLAGAYFGAEDATEKTEKATRSLAEVLNDSTASWEEVAAAARDYANAQKEAQEQTLRSMEIEAAAIAQRLESARATRIQLQAELERAELTMNVPAAADALGGGATIGPVLRGLDIEARLEANQKAIEKLGEAAAAVTVKVAQRVAEVSSDTGAKIKEGFAILRNEAIASIKDVNQLSARLTDLNRQEKAALDVLKESEKEGRKRRKGLSEEEKALRKLTREYESLANSAENYVSKLEDEAATFGLTQDEILLHNSAVQEAEARLNALGAPTAELQLQFIALADRIAMVTEKLIELRKAQRNTDYQNNVIRPLKEELSLVGKVGSARAEMAVHYDAAALKAKLEADGVENVNDKVSEYLELRLEILRQESIFEEETRQARLFEEQVNSVLGTLYNLRGGLGGIFGNAIGVLASGNPIAALGGLGRGGALAGTLLGGIGLQTSITNSIAGGLSQLGLNLDLAGDLAGGLFGGGIGSLIGGLVPGGSGIGGALGGAAGSFLPIPGGEIIGGILGSLVGGLFGSTKRGKATFSGGLDFGLSGNSGQFKEQAGGLAGSVVSTLQQIADAFGADLTGFTGTIGIRKGNLRYDPTGQGITKTSKGALDFGQDEEALLRAAIEDAISDGVFEGLSAGVERILQGEGSVDQKIADALSFQSVFKELERLKDPLGAALNEFEDQAAILQGVFDKAGASVEEYAQLEEYLGIKRQEVIDQFSQASEAERQQRELEIEIMRLQGDEQGALAAARQLELESLPESVRALQERVYALQDEALAAQQAAAVESERQSLNIRLAEALGDAEEVLRLRREAELAAVDPLNRALLESVQAAEQAALAQQRLAQAQAQAASSATSAASALSGAAGGNALGAIQDPLIGGVVSQFLTGGLDVNSAANQIRQAFSDQATAAFPNDLIQRSAFYNELVNSVAPQGGTPSFGIGTGPNAGGGGNPGDPGNGLSGSLGSGQQRSGSVRDAYVSLGGLQLWAQALMGGAGVGDLPGWGGFSSPAARERALARFGDLGNDGGRPGITQEQSAELADAYNREASEINKVISEYEKLRETLKAFDESLEIVGQTPRDTYAILRARFLETAGNASLGDKDALANLPGVGNQFLGAAERNASTSLQFRRDVALVRSAVGGGIAAADEAIDYQEAQLDALNRQVDGMIELKEEVRTVAEILRGIQGDNADFRREQQAENIAAVKNSAATAKTLDRVSQNGSSLRVDLTV